jgi:hypothetical protein
MSATKPSAANSMKPMKYAALRKRTGLFLALTVIGIGLSGCVVYERPYPHYYTPHYYYRGW